MFYIKDKTIGDRWQFHFESGQYMDEKDEEINIIHFFKKHKKIFGLFKKLGKVDYNKEKDQWKIGNEYRNSKGDPHRDDGPAYEHADGTTEWWVNGKLHREDGPAVEHASGDEEWYLNNELHRVDGPALEFVDGDEEWYLNGKLHREDGPATIDADGRKIWYLNGKLHREDGPATIGDDGTKFWYLNDKRHRVDGPAIEHANGDKEWFLYGELHREDGPAIEFVDGDKKWFLKGKQVKPFGQKKMTESYAFLRESNQLNEVSVIKYWIHPESKKLIHLTTVNNYPLVHHTPDVVKSPQKYGISPKELPVGDNKKYYDEDVAKVAYDKGWVRFSKESDEGFFTGGDINTIAAAMQLIMKNTVTFPRATIEVEQNGETKNAIHLNSGAEVRAFKNTGKKPQSKIMAFRESDLNESIESITFSIAAWMLTNPGTILKIIGFVGVAWNVLAAGFAAYSIYKTVKWMFEAVGITGSPKEVIIRAQHDQSYKNKLAMQLGKHFKDNPEDAKIAAKRLTSDIAGLRKAELGESIITETRYIDTNAYYGYWLSPEDEFIPVELYGHEYNAKELGLGGRDEAISNGWIRIEHDQATRLGISAADENLLLKALKLIRPNVRDFDSISLDVDNVDNYSSRRAWAYVNIEKIGTARASTMLRSFVQGEIDLNTLKDLADGVSKRLGEGYGFLSENLEEGPQDYDTMNLDADKKQESLNYFYHEHAPSAGAKPKKIGSFKDHDIMSFAFDKNNLLFLVKDDIPALYLAVKKYKDGLAVGNIRSNGTVRATDLYFYVLNNLTQNLYSDNHQTPDGRKIWANLEKHYDVNITDEGDRLHATLSKGLGEGYGFLHEDDDEKLKLPDLEVGDEMMVGK